MTSFLPLLEALEGEGQAAFWSGFLVFLRCGAAMALAPAFGEQSIPMRIRLGISLVMTFAVAPALPVQDQITPLKAVAEALNGLLLGIGFRFFVQALQIAGMIAAQSISLSHLFAGAGAEPQSAFSAVLYLGGLALACASGLHVKLAEAIILSYAALPQGRFPHPSEVADWGLAGLTACFASGFSLAAPFMIAGTLYNIALGAINRAMPMLMVVLIGAPAVTFGGLILLALTAPLMLQLWLAGFDRFLAAPFGVLR